MEKCFNDQIFTTDLHQNVILMQMTLLISDQQKNPENLKHNLRKIIFLTITIPEMVAVNRN